MGNKTRNKLNKKNKENGQSNKATIKTKIKKKLIIITKTTKQNNI